MQNGLRPKRKSRRLLISWQTGMRRSSKLRAGLEIWSGRSRSLRRLRALVASNRRYLRWRKKSKRYKGSKYRTVSHLLNSLCENHLRGLYLQAIGKISKY
jgi:hypothetical protein